MLMKIIILIMLAVILSCLGSALYFLLRDRGQSQRMLKALTLRISLSLILFILLLIAFAMGWITPNQI